MKKIAFALIVFLFSLNLRATVQIDVIGVFRGPHDNRRQWIEVANHSDSAVDIAGYYLQLEEEILFCFPPDTILKPQGSVRVFFTDSASASEENELCAVREQRLFSGRFYSPHETGDFIRQYEMFRSFRDETERRQVYAQVLPLLHRIPTILERLYVKTADGNVEDAVLVNSIYVNRYDGFVPADLTKIGLMPLTFLVREEKGFVNRQALVLPERFSVKYFLLARRKLLIGVNPGYLLAESQAEVELSLYGDRNFAARIWRKTAPVRTGSGIFISAEDENVLKTITARQIFFKMILRARNYQSEQITGSARFHVMDRAGE